MTALSEALSTDAGVVKIDSGTLVEGALYRVDNEVVRIIDQVLDSSHWPWRLVPLQYRVARGQAGTTRASHLSAAELTVVTPVYGETPFDQGGAAGGAEYTRVEVDYTMFGAVPAVADGADPLYGVIVPFEIAVGDAITDCYFVLGDDWIVDGNPAAAPLTPYLVAVSGADPSQYALVAGDGDGFWATEQSSVGVDRSASLPMQNAVFRFGVPSPAGAMVLVETYLILAFDLQNVPPTAGSGTLWVRRLPA